MPLARRFRLKTASLAVERTRGKSVAVTIPAGVPIIVNSDEGHDGYIWVTWDSRMLQMRGADLKERGEPIAARGQSAG